jgi:hypothetical protein
MATSNRDRVGQMFDLLAQALAPYIAGILDPHLPKGHDWTQLVALKDRDNGITGKEYASTDPLVQLRVLTENVTGKVKPGWYPFDGQLSQVQRSYASELRDTRNKWAHGTAFSDDDAYRALDTAERLLSSIGAGDSADRVARIRLDLRRVAAGKDDQRVLRAAAASPESAGLRPWREVLPPHDDVASGNFQSSEFAADLYKVATSSSDLARDYAEPTEFFARTYLTEGLRDLIGRAVGRLGGDNNASPVVNLQTNFGGGKTHSMLALWHLAAGIPLSALPQEWQELLSSSGYDALPHVRRVAIVGNHFEPSGKTETDGTKVNTIWGELAWQLGGAEAFELVAAADRDSTAPGGALHELLASYAPAVILIDEWVAYARQLYDRQGLAGGTFDTQFTFAQALTEAAKTTPGIFLAISIPASYDASDSNRPAAGSAEEVGGAHGLEALRRLQNVVRRVADQWRPATPDESYHIVRQRLFVNPDGAALAAIGATAREFCDFYRKHGTDFPREARDASYEQRIRRTYPIHPELFDRLYEDWSSLERFQRTRGVLRLMNAVIHALWVGGDAGALILPGSIPLATHAVNAELTQYLTDSWKAVIDADVDGLGSEPAKIDADRPLFGQRSLTKRLARTVFFGAAPTIGAAHKGLEAQRVFLGTAMPGDVPGNFHSALTQLGDRATYFYSGQGKYWYDLQANISRRAKDQAERQRPEDVWAEIARRLTKTQGRPAGGFRRVHVCPESHGDIPDADDARLVILHPRYAHKRDGSERSALDFAQEATERHGAGNRSHRNTLVFLAADHDRLAELETAVRDYLGWSAVWEERLALDLSPNQQNQAEGKRDQASTTVDARLLGTYQWALVPTAPDPGSPFEMSAFKAEGASDLLAERVSKKLQNDGNLNLMQSASNIRHALDTLVPRMWDDGHVSVGALWEVYSSYPYMPRLRDRDVLNDGVRSIVDLAISWSLEGFAVADDYDPHAGSYRGLVLPDERAITSIAVRDSLLLVRPEVAQAQRRKEADVTGGVGGTTTGGETGNGVPVGSADPGTTTTGPPAQPPKPAKRRYFGVQTLDPDRYAADFRKINDEVLAHLAAVPGVTLTVRIEIEAAAEAGFPDDKIRTVSENATTLKFDQTGFEEA